MFFFNDTATTEIYTLSRPDARPICIAAVINDFLGADTAEPTDPSTVNVHIPPKFHGNMIKLLTEIEDRKSTRLNSSHANISYAVFCLKKKRTRRAIPSAAAPPKSTE